MVEKRSVSLDLCDFSFFKNLESWLLGCQTLARADLLYYGIECICHVLFRSKHVYIYIYIYSSCNRHNWEVFLCLASISSSHGIARKLMRATIISEKNIHENWVSKKLISDVIPNVLSFNSIISKWFYNSCVWNTKKQILMTIDIVYDLIIKEVKATGGKL